MTGRKGMDSAVSRRSGNVYNRPSYGAVGNAVCRLWESFFTFPWAVNGVFHGGMAGYAHFHCAIFFVFQQSQCSARSIGQRPMKRSRGTRSQLRHGGVPGDWGPPQQAVLRSKTAECVPLCLACQFCIGLE